MQVPGNLHDGGTGIKDQGIAILHQICCSFANSSFLLMEMFAFLFKVLIVHQVVILHCPTVRTDEKISLFEVLQIFPDGYFRYVQQLTEFGNRNLPVFFQHFQCFITPFSNTVHRIDPFELVITML